MSGLVNPFQVKSANLYSKMTQLTRALGHLSAVYCVLFDRTGQFIITVSEQTKTTHCDTQKQFSNTSHLHQSLKL